MSTEQGTGPCHFIISSVHAPHAWDPHRWVLLRLLSEQPAAPAIGAAYYVPTVPAATICTSASIDYDKRFLHTLLAYILLQTRSTVGNAATAPPQIHASSSEWAQWASKTARDSRSQQSKYAVNADEDHSPAARITLRFDPFSNRSWACPRRKSCSL